MKSSLFRQQARESITSPERVNEYVRVTRPSLFILLAALLSCLIAVMLWIGYGTINDYVNVPGIAFPHSGFVKVYTPLEGVVTEVYVKRGSFVWQGERIMRFCYNGAYSYLTAPVSGIVLSHKDENESFKAVEACAFIYPQSTPDEQLREIRAYVTFKDLRKLAMGMEVQVSTADMPREEYGYMIGKIVDMSTYPIAREEAVKQLKTEALVNTVFPEEAAFEIKVMLDTVKDNPNQIRWSHSKNQNADMRIGTFCNLQILTKQRSIPELIFKKR